LPDDLHEFGLIPEFIGRFPIITFLRELDHATLLRILSEPRNALVKQYQQLFAYQGVKLEFSPAALSHIADQALLRRTGARGLRAVMEGALQRTMFEMPAQPQLRSCLLDLDGEGGELVVLRQFDEHLDAQSDAARPAVSAGARALLRVDG